MPQSIWRSRHPTRRVGMVITPRGQPTAVALVVPSYRVTFPQHVGDLAGTYNNGMNTRLCDGFQSSTCLNHTYLVPIVNTPCGGPINQSSPIIGFAAVTLTGANCTGA